MIWGMLIGSFVMLFGILVGWGLAQNSQEAADKRARGTWS